MKELKLVYKQYRKELELKIELVKNYIKYIMVMVGYLEAWYKWGFTIIGFLRKVTKNEINIPV